MAINLKDFQKALAQYKVYDAWQYVESLNEMLTYMRASFSLLEKVHEHRVISLKAQEQTILEKALTIGGASIVFSVNLYVVKPRKVVALCDGFYL